jgi:hypothetical protein
MSPGTPDRDRLATDLELLGILGDPTRGPLANLSVQTRPPLASPARPTLFRRTTRGRLAAALGLVQRLCLFRVNAPWPMPITGGDAARPANLTGITVKS